MIEPRKATAFGQTLYFAVCHTCECWVKSSTGQFVWVERGNRNRVVLRHKQLHDSNAL
jgi:hypothetical protein